MYIINIPGMYGNAKTPVITTFFPETIFITTVTLQSVGHTSIRIKTRMKTNNVQLFPLVSSRFSQAYSLVLCCRSDKIVK